ncbi:hypothetical protein ACPA9J_07865 [Pseudomonas aeruginosa]
MECAVLLCEGEMLLAEHFPSRAPEAEAPLKLLASGADRTGPLALACLRRNAGCRPSPRELGLPRRTFDLSHGTPEHSFRRSPDRKAHDPVSFQPAQPGAPGRGVRGPSMETP